MKEATGELNMTVITVVAIAAISLLFTVFVWPNIRANFVLNNACSQVDMNGNYTSSDIPSKQEGYIVCTDFTCKVVVSKGSELVYIYKVCNQSK